MQRDEKINIEKVDTIHKKKIEKLLRQLLIEIGENPDRAPGVL
jgi:GTP cyclohydrolase I